MVELFFYNCYIDQDRGVALLTALSNIKVIGITTMPQLVNVSQSLNVALEGVMESLLLQ